MSQKKLSSLPLVCLGYHPWSNMWKRNQSMTAELARQRLVERLLFLNPEVSLATSPGRIRRECRTVRRYSWSQILPRRPEPRVTVMTPIHLVPLRGRLPVLDRIDRHLIQTAVWRALGGRCPYLLLINTVRPESQELIELLGEDAVLRIFDWSDDFSRFQRDPRGVAEIARLTDALLESVDLVLTVNQPLAEHARRLNPRVQTVINATNMRALPADHQPGPGVRALAATLPGPILGYAGYINEHRVDVELVTELARRHPDWTVLFLGPVFRGFDRRFEGLPNVRFHPPVPYGELQDYLALFDVCLVPHLDNAHTAGNNPLKLYDYLTTGRPVVSTRIQGLAGFEDLVAVADSPAEFIAAVEQAVAERSAATADRRRAGAAEHHWSIRVAEVAAALAGALGGEADAAAPPVNAGSRARRAGAS